MPKKLELVGRRFDRLVVIAEHPDSTDGVRWLCLCDCGGKRIVLGKSLVQFGASSCGCKKTDPRTHGETGSGLYVRWRAMLDRTTNLNGSDYHNYGGRGISVCDRWIHSYEAFRDDMGRSFHPSLELDRIDVNGDYTPSNCRWATRKEQQRNKRNNHRLTVGEETMTLVEWQERTGIKANTILTRIRRGWSESRLLKLANAEASHA